MIAIVILRSASNGAEAALTGQKEQLNSFTRREDISFCTALAVTLEIHLTIAENEECS